MYFCNISYKIYKNIFAYFLQTIFKNKYKYQICQCFIVTKNTLMFIALSDVATLFPNKFPSGIQAENETSRSDFATDSEQENNTTSRASWN